MTCAHDGHFTHSPSGTRTAVIVDAAMGVFSFLNQGIRENFIRIQKTEDRIQKTEEERTETEATGRSRAARG
jgi:hypothetical protein